MGLLAAACRVPAQVMRQRRRRMLRLLGQFGRDLGATFWVAWCVCPSLSMGERCVPRYHSGENDYRCKIVSHFKNHFVRKIFTGRILTRLINSKKKTSRPQKNTTVADLHGSFLTSLSCSFFSFFATRSWSFVRRAHVARPS